MATFTKTSPGPGCGTGRSMTRMSRGPKSTAERIVSGMVHGAMLIGDVDAMPSSAYDGFELTGESQGLPYGPSLVHSLSIHAGISIRHTLNVSTDEIALSCAGEFSIMAHTLTL